MRASRPSSPTKRSLNALTIFPARMRYLSPSRTSSAPSFGPSFSKRRIHSSGYQCAWMSMVFISAMMPSQKKEDCMVFKTLAAAALALAAAAGPASAQDAYPSRPVKIIVPYGPGGATDIIARIVGQHLTETLGQTFLVENRPGANGNIALEAAAKAPADGYTLLVGNVSTNAINESAFAGTLKIKPSRDLAGVTKLVEIPHTVVATANLPANNIAELIALCKKEPGKLNFASVGIGSYPHLDMERFERAAGIQLTHVPYKGGAGQAIPALISG